MKIRKRKTTRNGLATLKRLKRGDENKLERSLRLEKVVSRKQLRLAVEIEEERRVRLENDAATKRLMLAQIQVVVNMGVVLSLKPILKS